MTNYLRYFAVAALIFGLWYKYTITIPKEVIETAIENKLPLKVEKNQFIVNIKDFKVMEIDDTGFISTVITGDGALKENSIARKVLKNKKVNGFLSKMFKSDDISEDLDTPVNFKILSTSKPKLEGSKLSFEVSDFDIESKLDITPIKSLLIKTIEKISIKIKKLETLGVFAKTKSVKFQTDGDLDVGISVNPFILYAGIFLLLLREIGIFLIMFYQKFLSPRKGYTCAKNHVHQNGSCSSTTKQAFVEGGFISGMREYRKSTLECKEAYSQVKEQERKNKNSNQSCADNCAGCEPTLLPTRGCGLHGSKNSANDCGPGDCGPGDCGPGDCNIGHC